MSIDDLLLEERLASVQSQLADIAIYIQSAVAYATSDPQSSLTKSRIAMEKLISRLYHQKTGRAASSATLGKMISSPDLAKTLPRRILSRINAIRDMANMGPHGGEVETADAVRVLRDLTEVLEWYVKTFPRIHAASPWPDEARTAVEILPGLKHRFAEYLRPDITSVKFGQVGTRCYLEMTTMSQIAGYLTDETIKRTDLGFVMGGDHSAEGLFFNPAESVSVNAERFLNDFDEISIINCTDLFTSEAAAAIYEAQSEVSEI